VPRVTEKMQFDQQFKFLCNVGEPIVRVAVEALPRERGARILKDRQTALFALLEKLGREFDSLEAILASPFPSAVIIEMSGFPESMLRLRPLFGPPKRCTSLESVLTTSRIIGCALTFPKVNSEPLPMVLIPPRTSCASFRTISALPRPGAWGWPGRSRKSRRSQPAL
jgi:hypothetical protein